MSVWMYAYADSPVCFFLCFPFAPVEGVTPLLSCFGFQRTDLCKVLCHIYTIFTRYRVVNTCITRQKTVVNTLLLMSCS